MPEIRNLGFASGGSGSPAARDGTRLRTDPRASSLWGSSSQGVYGCAPRSSVWKAGLWHVSWRHLPFVGFQRVALTRTAAQARTPHGRRSASEPQCPARSRRHPSPSGPAPGPAPRLPSPATRGLRRLWAAEENQAQTRADVPAASGSSHQSRCRRCSG